MDPEHSGHISLSSFARVCSDLHLGEFEDLLVTITEAAGVDVRHHVGTESSAVQGLPSETAGGQGSLQGGAQEMDYREFLQLVLGGEGQAGGRNWLSHVE